MRGISALCKNSHLLFLIFGDDCLTGVDKSNFRSEIIVIEAVVKFSISCLMSMLLGNVVTVLTDVVTVFPDVVTILV